MDEKRLVVRKLQEYMNLHLKEPISLNDLCREVAYSPSYVTKAFKELTGHSPYNYLKALRLSNAAKLLRDEEVKVIDVALDFVFDSHEGFTRAFSKQFGLGPKLYAAKKPPIQWFLPYPVHMCFKEVETVNQFIFTQIIERPKRKALIKRAKSAREYFKYCEEVGCDVWGVLTSVKEALYEPVGFWLPDHLISPGTSMYVQGVEVPSDYNNVVPEGFDLIDLDPCKVMIFQGQPYDDDLYESVIVGMMEAMDGFDPSLYGLAYAPHDGPRFQLEPRGERGYIEGRPVRFLKE